jgi:hypothetical protein
MAGKLESHPPGNKQDRGEQSWPKHWVAKSWGATCAATARVRLVGQMLHTKTATSKVAQPANHQDGAVWCMHGMC